MSLNIIVATVNWNLKEETIDCIQSLLRTGIPPDNILIVDNGSNDDSVEVFKRILPSKISILQNIHNLGLACAYNQGILFALQKQAQWILLINNDVVVGDRFKDELINTLQTKHNYAILSPTIFMYHKPNIVWSLGDRRIPGTLLTVNPYRGKQINHPLPDIIPMDFISGCAMLLNKDVLDKIGLFDTNLFMYGEELNYCWRAHLTGYQIGSMSKVKIWHKISTSVNKDKPKMRYYRIRNQNRFYRKYSWGINIIIHFIFTVISTSCKCILDLLRRQIDLIPPTFRGWRDGWFSNKGESL